MSEPKPIVGASIPRPRLGLPGRSYQLYGQPAKSGVPRTPPSPTAGGLYRVVLLLTQTLADLHNLNFQTGLTGDSFVHFAKPQKDRTASDADELVISFGQGTHKLELKGAANAEGRLAEVTVEMRAAGFTEAEERAFGAISPFLSSLAFDLDIPVSVARMHVTQLGTQCASITYTCPYSEVLLGGEEFKNVPYVQSLLSLYREGINSYSPNYQFLCWYKIVEGINCKRAEEASQKRPAPVLKFPERLANTKVGQRKQLEEAFPFIKAAGSSNDMWDDIVPDEVLGWKFNRVRQEVLEALRNKIAHMISDASGDFSLSPDSRENLREVTKWVSLLRFMARMMTMNESARHPL
jgi:hypothetical protein